MPEPLPPRLPSGRITFALIEALSLGTLAPREHLEAALIPGTRIERHNRVWRMGQWHVEGNSIVGRIGYEASGVAELWDEGIGDFSEQALPTGLTSPFAIDPETLRVAFQIRGRDIRVKSFTGALQALLNEASPTERWRVSRELSSVAFEEWARHLDRVTVLRLNLERPNPHYGPRKRVEGLIEGSNAKMAEVVLRADLQDLQGLDINDPFIQESIEHVAHNYGSYTAFGEQDGEETTWTSEQEGAAEIRRVPADPLTRDVSSQILRRELGDPTVEREQIDEARRAIEEARAAENDDPLLDELEDPDEG